MNNLIDLFKIIEITRDQVQYGYNLAGIQKHELSDLAQHHYLVTFIAWQLCRQIKNAGGNINTERVMEIAMVHDLGELMGGDINSFYAKINPKARTLAKEFEHENNLFLGKFFGDDEEYYQKLILEMGSLNTDESLVAKVADYMEVLCYKQRLKKLLPQDDAFANSIQNIGQKIKDEISRSTIIKILQEWGGKLNEQNYPVVDLSNGKF